MLEIVLFTFKMSKDRRNTVHHNVNDVTEVTTLTNVTAVTKVTQTTKVA